MWISIMNRPRFLNGLVAATALAAMALAVTPATAQTAAQTPAAEKEQDTAAPIAGERRTPLLNVNRERSQVTVPVACAPDVRKDVELQPADSSVTFSFDCLCSEDANALKQAMMRYRDDYMRVYRKEITLDQMGTAADYFSDVALPFTSGGDGGTQLTMLLQPGEKQEKTVHCYTEEDFKLIDDWARYIIFGN